MPSTPPPRPPSTFEVIAALEELAAERFFARMGRHAGIAVLITLGAFVSLGFLLPLLWRSASRHVPTILMGLLMSHGVSFVAYLFLSLRDWRTAAYGWSEIIIGTIIGVVALHRAAPAAAALLTTWDFEACGAMAAAMLGSIYLVVRGTDTLLRSLKAEAEGIAAQLASQRSSSPHTSGANPPSEAD